MWRHLTWCLGEMPWRIPSGKQQQQHACTAPPHFIWLFCFASSSFCLLFYHTFGFYFKISFSFCCHQTRDWFSQPFPSPDRTNVGRPRKNGLKLVICFINSYFGKSFFTDLWCKGIDFADTGCNHGQICSWETIKGNQSLFIWLVINVVASDISSVIL